MRIELERSGGFAGLTLRAALDTSELAPPLAGGAEAALARLPWGDQAPTAPRGADHYQYKLDVVDDAEQRRSVVLFEPDIPDELRPLIQQLVAQGQFVR